jgi:hypothetical protein
MADLTRTYSDNNRTFSILSGDTLPGQTRTYAFRHVQMSGVRCPDGQQARAAGGLKFSRSTYETRPVSTSGTDE